MYVKPNRIYIGSLNDPDYYYENDQIISTPSTQAVAMIGQELSVDEFTPTIADDPISYMNVLHFRSSDGKEIRLANGQIFALDVSENLDSDAMLDIEDGTPMWYYHDTELVGKFYISAVTRLTKTQYKIQSESAIGRLSKMYHGGGLFLASTFGTVLAHILASGLHGTGNPVIDYEIDEDVAALPVSGWLPYASKRENLYRLIFANGVNIIKNDDGNPRFTFIYSASDQATPIDSADIENSGDIEYTKPYSSVSILEHTYVAIASADSVTLFDNTESGQVSNEEIWFDNAPIIVSSLQTSGSLVLVSATENSAIISGAGVLTGVPYTHTTRTVSRTNPFRSTEKTVTVTDCTMVNQINSTNLLNRLYAFYCPSEYIKKITNSIKYTDQRCGKAYQFENPRGETEIAYLARMDMNASSFRKADCEWYTGYEPAGQQGLYTHVVVCVPYYDEEDPETLLYEGDWEVPDGVTEFKVVMIGGGTGGGSGHPGEAGSEADTYTDVAETDDLSGVWYGAEGGDGGEGGTGGTPGRVKTITIDDAVAGTVYHWEVGEGGEGGAATSSTTPNVGSDGTASTFGIEGGTTYSTDDQDSYVPIGGIYEPIHNEYYALMGKVGIHGGKGGARQVMSNGVFNWVTDGEDVVGEDGTVYRGGSTGTTLVSVEGLPEAKLKAYGGNGAGAAIGIGRNVRDEETGELVYTDMNGQSDQETSWTVTEDS